MSLIVLFVYRISYFLAQIGLRPFGVIVNTVINRLVFGCQIGLGAKFGEKCVLGYGGLGVVIHKDCIIGDRVMIGPNSTLGGRNKRKGLPVIGNDSILSTGAKILGPVKIGKCCVVGANSVVVSDVEDYSVVAGVPARVIKTNISIDDYR